MVQHKQKSSVCGTLHARFGAAPLTLAQPDTVKLMVQRAPKLSGLGRFVHACPTACAGYGQGRR